ncbi:MAG: 50S ribosome-binding GTPase [Phycisphaerae bacterium]|nr:MAG: hypothetical protein EDS66_13460 [Planctomycetota bacterium]KAB2949735.1 MAG: hypothetical protein F9K17_02025 [Phycisphaerae bacterium]MBE7457505.1 50S ribosome-binding GTPase [Planctomycetia bacterium]MCK6464544.1 dynamin family protein [Phycisphaerae bacterium]MCL4718881.1 50S ribosome-binding GTPase [Phycisphaerae bacterium]
MISSAANPPAFHDPLDIIAEHGARLRDVYKFSWTDQAQQTALSLRMRQGDDSGLQFVAVVGGASSGKSTLFNNLLEGHRASRITARGHATLGPIVAVHASRVERVEELIQERRLWPTLKCREAGLDGEEIGAPGEVLIVSHGVEALRDVVLIDTPDFTSEDARTEGDVTLSLMPWFDRLIVVIDHERWFDRQAIADLKQQATRFRQPRLAVFNRTREGVLSSEQEERLREQGRRLGAENAVILEFRRGRGFCRFAPGALDAVEAFVRGRGEPRSAHLRRLTSEFAGEVLNQNRERTARLRDLRVVLDAAAARFKVQPWDCYPALMTPAEREHLDVVSRVLRLRQARDWIDHQRRKLERVLTRVPMLGWLSPRSGSGEAARAEGSSAEVREGDRLSRAWAYFEQAARRRHHELTSVAQSSRFWDEVRNWTGETSPVPVFTAELIWRERVTSAGRRVDASLTAWSSKVSAECQGLGLTVAGGVAVVLLLAAVPGPLLGIPLPLIVAALGGGAAGAKPLGRLAHVARERLIGSVEFLAVRDACADFAALVDDYTRQCADEQYAVASRWVMPADDPLTAALARLEDAEEGS